MEEEFVSYEQALALQQLGFDWGTYEHYDSHTKEICDIMKHVRAPLKQQVFRWFREKYELLGYIDSSTEPHGIEYSYNINILKEGHSWFQLYIETYENAENQCIDRLIELVKKKQDEETK
jgi:hypothetical protein